MVTHGGGSTRLAEAFERRGAGVWNVPLIQIEAPADWSDADSALRDWGVYDWVVFTSGNAVTAVHERLAALGVPAIGRGPRIAVVGSTTGRLVESFGWQVALCPAEQRAVGLAREIVEGGQARGKRVLFPKGDIAREALPAALRAAGATVREVLVYRTVPAATDVEAVGERLRSGGVDAIAFSSPSAVRAFVDALGADIWNRLPPALVVASIGPTTSQALEQAGRRPDAQARSPNAEALAEAVADTFARA